MAEGCHDVACATSEGIGEAVRLAREADVVVLVLGLDTTQEDEGRDRAHLELPGYQLPLSLQVMALHKPMVVVLLNGGMLTLDEFKDHPTTALLEAFYPSTQGSDAIADVIFGNVSPSGKLPYTVYPRTWVEQVDFLNTSMSDGPGRTYRYYHGKPLWPFGYGLTYSSLSLEVKGRGREEEPLWFNATSPDSLVTITITITNTGSRPMDDVIMVYLVPLEDVVITHPGPQITSQLIDFRRLTSLSPGGSKEESFQYHIHQVLALVDVKGNCVIAPGTYQLVVTNGVEATVTAMITWGGEEVVLDQFPHFWQKWGSSSPAVVARERRRRGRRLDG